MSPGRRTPSTLHLTWGLLLTLALLNAASLLSIVASRRGAREAAEHDLELRAAVFGRSVESELSSLRADLLFVSRSPPLVGFFSTLDSPDPLVRRWRRLDAEGTLLLFLEAHPEVRRLEVVGPGGEILVAAGWLAETAPTMLPPGEEERSAPEGFSGWWPADPRRERGHGLRAEIDRSRLLAGVVPVQGSLSLSIGERAVDAPAAVPARSDAPVPRDPKLSVEVPIDDDDWTPPIRWLLDVREEEGRLLQSIQTVTGLYGTTVALNAAVMVLSVGLGLLAFRNLRRTARLEAEREQQERVRELERQLFHSERLASVGRLAAGLAHEVNNPLEGVSNYLSLIEEDLTGDGQTARGDDTLRLVQRAREGVVRAAEVIRQVLAYADPARGGMTSFDVADAARRSVDFVRGSRDHGQVDIELELPDRPLPIEGNPVAVGQVLLNMLMNACEAMSPTPSDPGPRPQPGRVLVTVEALETTARIRVADRGPGIADAELDRLFEPFFSTKGSSGLGLAVSKGIVDAHGGTLSATNRQGGGAEMTLILPVHQPEERVAS